MRVAWTPREAPLQPRAAVARGAAGRALARRLAALDDQALAALTGAHGDDGLFAVLGAAEALPWVDGVQYLGRDDDAPRLLLPTTLAPTVPAALLEQALLARVKAAPLGVVVGDDGAATLVPLAGARRIERALLAALIGGRAP